MEATGGEHPSLIARTRCQDFIMTRGNPTTLTPTAVLMAAIECASEPGDDAYLRRID